MDIEFDTLSDTDNLADIILDTADFKKLETTDEYVDIHVKTYYGPLVIRRSLSDDHVTFEAL